MEPITLWRYPGEPIITTRGTVTYREWCEREVRRIRRHGVPAMIVENKRGQIAVG